MLYKTATQTTEHKYFLKLKLGHGSNTLNIFVSRQFEEKFTKNVDSLKKLLVKKKKSLHNQKILIYEEKMARLTFDNCFYTSLLI